MYDLNEVESFVNKRIMSKNDGLHSLMLDELLLLNIVLRLRVQDSTATETEILSYGSTSPIAETVKRRPQDGESISQPSVPRRRGRPRKES